MIKTIWNSFRYGNNKTKLLILSVFLLYLTALACLLIAVVKKEILWGLGMMFAFIMGIIIMQSVSFKGSGRFTEEKKKKAKKEKKKKEEKKKEEKKRNGPKADDFEDVEEKENGRYIETLDETGLKLILYEYKVKKDHIPIMIDSWSKERVKQCPAYVWKTKGRINFLLLEKKPRQIMISSEKIKHIYYHPGVTAKRNLDYVEFQKPSFASLTFGSLLPVYYEESGAGKTVAKKNLYCLESDIMLTSTSIRGVMEMLKIPVVINDRIMNSARYTNYFKEGYKINVLWKDGVYSTQEFKLEIKKMLKKLAETEISLQAFDQSITQLVSGRLITREYAEYYVDYRQKYHSKKMQ